MESLVGRTLGKYELTAMIGGGGMATVYKAHHPGLDQQVAVKILHPFLSTDPSFVDRFRREARAVAALRYPNIVRVLDFDHEDHLYYMVMEYIGGPTLSTVLSGRKDSGGLSLPEIGRIFTPLCGAIDYAASRGMVHRDIKPANIIMTDDGEPIITDYGIAKMIGSTSLTSPGTVVGSAHYMSPEQAQGQDCDVRSDLYSLGVVLFECLAGVVPFEGDTTVTVLIKHISAPVPSILSLRPNLPPAIEPMLARALAKQPQDRYEMGVTFAEELMSALAPSKSTLTATEVVASAAALSETVLSETPSAPTPPSSAAAPPTVETTPPPDVEPAPMTPEPTAPEATISATEAAMTAAAAETPPIETPRVETLSAPSPTPALDATAVEQEAVDPTRLETVAPVEAAASLETAQAEGPPTLPMTGEEAPPAPPPPPASTQAETMAVSAEAVPPGKVGQPTPEVPTEAEPEAALAAAAGQGTPPRRLSRNRLIVVAVLAVVLLAAIGAGTTLALQGGGTESTTTLPVTTTGTTLSSTTTSALTTSTTARLTTTTTRLTTTTKRATTTTARPTTTTAKATATTAKPTTTVKRTTTTKAPTTTQPTSPPDTIGPGTTSPPDTIGPG